MAGVLAVGPVMSPDAAARLIAACERFPVFTPSGIGSFAGDGNAGALAWRPPSANPNLAGRPPDPTALIRPRSQATGRRPGELLAPRRSSGGAGRFAAVGQAQVLQGDPARRERGLRPRYRGVPGQPVSGRGRTPSSDSELVVPWNVYANVMLPGQELGMHTDTPEFRGAHRDFLQFGLCAQCTSRGCSSPGG